MSKLRYIDFDVYIQRSGTGYRAQVSSPVGQTGLTFTLPFSDVELENLLLKLGRRRGARRGGNNPASDAARAFGRRLFTAVFDDEVRACLRSSIIDAKVQEAGVRIRLRLTEAPELLELPWEFLYNPSGNRFLALAVETPIVRYLDISERIQPLSVQLPLRILVMISSPSDYEALDVAAEWANLGTALGELERRGVVVVDRLAEASLTALKRKLRQGTYHIFHFIGHGEFDQTEQTGALVMMAPDGRGRVVASEDLGTLLHNHPALRLAVLNTCEGARTSRTDPFAGTAQALVQQGIPAVIAMQFEVSDAVAITFANEFYGALADGYPVDAALVEARTAIFAEHAGAEWGTPVLYMRSPDGVLFDVPQEPPARPATAVRAPSAWSAPAVAGDVFVSYSHVDADWVLGELVPRLDAAGIAVQIDTRTFEIGVPTLVNIERAVDSCRHTLVVMSPEWVESQWADFESLLVGSADPASRRRKLVPLVLKPCTPPRRIALLTHIDFTDATTHAAQFTRLITSLRSDTLLLDGSLPPAAADPTSLRPTSGSAPAAVSQHALSERDLLVSAAHAAAAAEHWDAVVTGFAQITALDPTYGDPEGLLATATQRLRSVERVADAQQRYMRAQQLISSGAWVEAHATLTALVADDPGYGDAPMLLAFVAARAAEEAQLEASYSDAQTALAAADWAGALEALSAILSHRPEYRDTGELYKAAQRQQTVALRRAAAAQALEAGQWNDAVRHAQVVLALDEGNNAAAQLLATAREEQALALAYTRGADALARHDWDIAIAHLAGVVARRPEYADAAALLDTARLQARLAELYDAAQKQAQNADWVAVLQTLDTLAGLEPTYHDPLALAVTARAQLEQQARRQQLDERYKRALLAVNAGDWGAAAQMLGALAQEAPNFRDVKALAEQARKEQGEQEDRRAQAAQLQALYASARAAVEQLDWATATRVLEQIMLVAPSYRDVAALLRQARRAAQIDELKAHMQAAFAQGDWNAAIAHGRSILTLEPGHGDARELLPRAEQAQATAQQLAALERELAAAVARAASDTVIRVGEQMLALDPERQVTRRHVAAAYAERAQLQATRGDYDGALSDATRSIALEPAAAAHYAARGRLHMQQQQYDRAVRDFRHATAIEPQSARFAIWLGAAYFNQGAYADAIDVLDRAIGLAPTSAEPFAWRGLCRHAAGHAAALGDYDQALLRDATNPAYRYARFLWYTEHGDAARADADYALAIETDPTHTRFYAWRGGLQLGAETDRPQPPLERSVAGNTAPAHAGQPAAPVPPGAATLVARARAAFAQMRYTAALADLDQAVALDEQYAPAYFWRGRCALQQAEHARFFARSLRKRALADLTRALECAPDSAEYLFWRGRAYEQVGDHVAAHDDFERAARLGWSDPDAGSSRERR